MDIEQLAGTKLGNYEIESLLGRGGMGVVYKARQVNLDRPVALKILPPSLSSDSSFVKRFQREARAVAKLSHPNILHIYDVGEEKDLHFFSMEYIGGRTLDEVLKAKGHLHADEAVRIIAQAAQGIDHAHRNGIIHRDIKPSNIILDELGNVKVMDFGLARMTDDRSKLTQSGTLMGTLDYMSPEQCRGEELDERTDIYSLGVVFYEMLTGRTPFDAPNEAAVINKIINEEPPAARGINPDVPVGLNTVAERSMSKYKEDRYASISELLADVRKHKGQTQLTAVVESRTSPSIAVLPFVNMSADPEQEYFCDGLAEELINALTQLKDLHVVARTSAFSFKGKDTKIRDIGRELNVGTVLEGSVRKAGNRLRITAQLVKVTDGYHLWSERFDREMDDVFAIQDEITHAIVGKLKPRLLRTEKAKLARRQTVDLDAYNLYLKGRWFYGKQMGHGLKKAIECFEQAIEKAPDYAQAYAGIADSYVMLPFIHSFPPREAYPKAREAALKAMRIDDTAAEARVSLAVILHVYKYDWDGAEKEFKRAIELDPGYAMAHDRYALFLVRMGRLDEGIAEMKRALELDPLSLQIHRIATYLFCLARKPDQAIDIAQRAIELDPNYSGAHAVLGYAYFQNSMYEEAIEEYRKEKEGSSGLDPAVDAGLGVIDALTGNIDEAKQVLENLIERSKREYIPPWWIAWLSFVAEGTDQGFDWLEKAYEEHDNWLCHLMVDPLFELLDLRSDPRYIALLKKIGLDK